MTASGVAFAQTISDLRRLLHFLPDETGQAYTYRIFAIAEQIERGETTIERVQEEEQGRVERGEIQQGWKRGKRVFASYADREAFFEQREKYEREQLKPRQNLSVHAELHSDRQARLRRAKQKYQ